MKLRRAKKIWKAMFADIHDWDIGAPDARSGPKYRHTWPQRNAAVLRIGRGHIAWGQRNP